MGLIQEKKLRLTIDEIARAAQALRPFIVSSFGMPENGIIKFLMRLKQTNKQVKNPGPEDRAFGVRINQSAPAVSIEYPGSNIE